MQTNFPLQIKSAEIQGVYNNGEQRNNVSSTISLQSINCQVNGKDLKGSLTYSNFNNPHIQTQFNTELNLEDIQKWGYDIPLQKLSGKAKITGNYKGKIGFKNDIKNDFEQAEKSATIQFTNTSFQYKPLALFHSLNGKIRLLNNRLEIDSVRGSAGQETKLKFVGTIEHLFTQNQELQIAGHLSSDWLKMSELITPDTAGEPTPYYAKKHFGKHYNKFKDASTRSFTCLTSKPKSAITKVF